MRPKDNSSTRRSFLSGALVAAPLAAAAPAAALGGAQLEARIERLEDEAAIRELHASWLRRVNGGEQDARLDAAVHRITADHTGAPDKIEIAADGRSAAGVFECAVEAETPLPEHCTLAQMARAQGHGGVLRTERRRLTIDYAKTGGTWTIAKLASAPLPS